MTPVAMPNQLINIFSERNTMINVLAQVPSYRALLEGISERFYFHAPQQQDDSVVAQLLDNYNASERLLLNSIPVHDQDVPVDPQLQSELDNFNNSIAQMKETYPDLVWVYVINDKTQDILARNLSVGITYLADSQPWYKSVTERRKLVVTAPSYETNSNQYTFIVAIPIFEDQIHAEGETLGAYVINTSYTAFVSNVVSKWGLLF